MNSGKSHIFYRQSIVVIVQKNYVSINYSHIINRDKNYGKSDGHSSVLRVKEKTHKKVIKKLLLTINCSIFFKKLF